VKKDKLILLKDCFYIATFNDNGDEIRNQNILIKGNKIEKISKDIKLSNEEINDVEIIDCSHHLVIPGMINTHHHFFQTLTRNLPKAQNAKLFDWLKTLYPVWEKIDEKAIYWSTLLATAELLKTGATTTADHHYLYPSRFVGDIMGIQFDAAQEIGIRFSPSRGSMTRGESNGGLPPDSVIQGKDEVIKDMRRIIEKHHNPSPLSMRRIILAPCSPFSVDKKLMIETAKLARSYGVRMHTHLAETKEEEEYCRRTYGKRPLELMKELGWLGEDVFFAHGIWFKNDELNLLKETNTGISHCPTSNMRLGSGIARIREMIDMGITVGLGVDGASSNDTSDMLGEVRNAMLLQRIRYGPSGLTAREALRIAIKGGARLLNFLELGSIEEGKGADIVIYDMDQLQYAGSLSDPLASIVFTGFNHQTAYTIVNGKIVVRNGKLAHFDENEINHRVNEISKNIIG